MSASSRRRNPLERGKRKRAQKKVIYLLTEGLTERDYLSQLSLRNEIQKNGIVSEKIVRQHPGRTDPSSLVRAMRRELAGADFRKDDEAWIIFDVDQWSEAQIDDVLKWVSERDNHRVAISNPKFELFLLLHFEDAKGCTASSELDARLKRAWGGDGSKRIPPTRFSIDEIKEACNRSKERLLLDEKGVPVAGSSQVHLAVDSLLTAG